MAGKTYIGGTAYDITGGKTLIGGTAYDINAGKTLIGGTAYDIVFKKPVTIKELFSDVTILGSAGRNNSGTGRIYLSTSISDTTNSAYLFSIYNGGLSIWKISGALSTISTTALKFGGSVTTGIYNYNSGARIYYRTNGYSSGTSTTGGTAVRGATLAIIRFPNYDDNTVETILSGMTITTEIHSNSSSSSTGYITFSDTDKTDNTVFLASLGTYFDTWSYSTGSPTRISGTTTAAATVNETSFFGIRLAVTGYGYSGIQLDYTPV